MKGSAVRIRSSALTKVLHMQGFCFSQGRGRGRIQVVRQHFRQHRVRPRDSSPACGYREPQLRTRSTRRHRLALALSVILSKRGSSFRRIALTDALIAVGTAEHGALPVVPSPPLFEPPRRNTHLRNVELVWAITARRAHRVARKGALPRKKQHSAAWPRGSAAARACHGAGCSSVHPPPRLREAPKLVLRRGCAPWARDRLARCRGARMPAAPPFLPLKAIA